MYNPLKDQGISINDQFRNWKELNTQPYDKDTVHPYTRTAGILMNGIEVEAAIFSHNFARHTTDPQLKEQLALIRRLEQAQQKAVNWMIPGDESTLEVTVGYEQVAVDLTAFLARHETNPYVKDALDFALLEDFDHLYRYSNLMRDIMDKDASQVTKEYTEITVGRPTVLEHRYPADDVRKFTDCDTADLMTCLHIETITAAEQQTMNYYMNVGNRFTGLLERGLYQEIAQVEEQHVTHYESLMDPRASWFEMWFMHELNECWLYYSLSENDYDARAKRIWKMNLDMEIEHLRIAAQYLKEHDRKDPDEIIKKGFTHLFKFEPNIDYVRDILTQQVGYNAMGTEFVQSDRMPKDYRYYRHQEKVNAGGAPSEKVIEEVVRKDGHDYRQELRGPNPIERFRQKVAVG